jgi:hypothetical protein
MWYSALASPHGVVIRTDDPHYTKQRLYALRKALADPALDTISIMTSPANPDDIWLVKRSRGDAEEERLSPTEGDP